MMLLAFALRVHESGPTPPWRSEGKWEVRDTLFRRRVGTMEIKVAHAFGEWRWRITSALLPPGGVCILLDEGAFPARTPKRGERLAKRSALAAARRVVRAMAKELGC